MDSLFVIQGVDQGRRYTLDESVTTIGRDTSNKLRLRDPEASRRHAEIRLKTSGRILVDLESSNGVFVNGQQIQNKKLVNGDQIQIGKTILLFASRTLDVGAQEPLVDVFQEADVAEKSRVLHSLAPEESRQLFDKSAENEVKAAWLEKARAHLNFMYHATLATSRTLDVEKLLDRILELVFQWAPVDRGCIFIYDADADKLVPKSSRSRKKDGRVMVSQTILNFAFRNQKGVLTSNASNDERWDGAASVFQTGVKEAICVPMQGRYGLVGVIYIDVSRRLMDIETETPDAYSFYSPLPKSPNNEVNSSKQNNSSKVLNKTRFSNKQISSSVKIVPPSKELALNSPVETLKENGDLSPNENSSDCHFSNSSNKENNANGMTSIPSNPDSQKLTVDHLKLMVAIGRQAALAVEDTQYYLGMAQAERLAAIGQTVAVLSHHIKNILQGIRGGSFLIHTGLNEHNETLVAKGWNIVEKNQAKISDLVLDMLTFSKERTPVWSFTNLNNVMLDVVELMKGRAEDLEVDLEFTPNETIPSFYFDKEQIHRAIVNLIGNALEASKDYDPELPRSLESGLAKTNQDSTNPRRQLFPRGRVETMVNFIAETKTVIVTVDDVGPGIPIEMRETLFKPFTSKNKSGGTGLGLAVTHKIVQEHKGKIIVEDSPLGGARFVVELPLILEKPSEDESN